MGADCGHAGVFAVVSVGAVVTVTAFESIYRRGYLVGMANKPKEPPEALTQDELAIWLRGYDHAVKDSRDSHHSKPTFTR